MLRCNMILLSVSALGLLACPGADQCQTGADCPSGACSADGKCVMGSDETGEETTDGDDATGSTTTIATTSAEDTSDDAADGSGSGGAVACMPPDADGLIERDEYPVELGLTAPYRAAQDVAFDTAGALVDGTRVWDFDVSLTGDHDTIWETLPIEGRWFQPLFPGATYAARLSDGQDLLGVFEATDTALLLRGVVSPTDGLTRTELTYEPPVTVLSFPIWEGQTWTSDATVSGLAQGVAAFYTESYSGAIDASGTAVTPFTEFPVLRANVALTRTVGLVVTNLRTHTFIAECFGIVAQVRSPDNEDGAEFTQAAEVRRLAP